MTEAVLSVAAGSGRLARRVGAILFVASDESLDLLARFEAAATDAEAIDEVKRQLIATEFEAPPVVALRWTGDAFDVVLFGDIELRSSAAAASMITGAGSATWVERHIGEIELAGATEADVWCGDEPADGTDLKLGTIAASGFRATLTFSGPSGSEPGPNPLQPPQPQPAPAGTPPSVPIAAAAPPIAAARQPEPKLAPAPSPAPEPEPEPGPKPMVAAAPEPEPVPEPVALAPEPVKKSAADPFAGDPPTEPPPVLAPREESASESSAEPAKEPDPFAGPSGVGLVEAAMCENGHPNPPGSPACLVCRAALTPDSSLQLIEQPKLGQLVFGDGQAVAIEGTLILGRKPVAEDDQAVEIVIDQAEVSRSHASVAVEGWAALLTDLGSRNGTYVTAPGTSVPIRLEGSVPHFLESGTTVHLGGPDVAFTYAVETEGS